MDRILDRILLGLTLTETRIFGKGLFFHHLWRKRIGAEEPSLQEKLDSLHERRDYLNFVNGTDYTTRQAIQQGEDVSAREINRTLFLRFKEREEWLKEN